MGSTLTRQFGRALLVPFAVALTVASFPHVALAHTFLVRSSPEAGARLRMSPDEVVLDFTELVASGFSIDVHSNDGQRVDVLSVGTDVNRSRLRASLPALDDGVYQVTWRVVADDGHSTEGEFVFAVGVAVPADATAVSRPDTSRILWADALAALAMLGGLAVAFGGLLGGRFIWTSQPTLSRPGFVTGGVVVGLVGALSSVALAVHRAGVLTEPGRWADSLTTRADRANVGAVVLLAVALLLVQRRRTRVVALVPLAGAIVMVAVRGHAPEASEWWATPATAAHILVAGAWIGALAHLALVARASTANGIGIEPGPSRYAKAALVAAVMTLLIGVAVAFSQLEQLGDLTGTRYGQILLVKLLLVAVGLIVAFVARRRGIPAAGPRIRQLARYTTIEAATLVGVLVASALLSTTAPAVGLGNIELPAAPLPDPTTLTSGLAGSHQVLVAAALDRLQITVTPPGGQPTRQQTSTFSGVEPDGTPFDLQPRPCGPGCFDIAHHWTDGTTRFTVTVTNPDADGGTAQLAVVWPPGPDATTILVQAIAATRAAGDITVTETVSSGPAATFGPDDLMTTGDDYISASPFSNGADDVYGLPAQDGLTVIAFIVSGTGTWHQLSIDDQHRVRTEILVDPGHRIDRTITYRDVS